MNWSKTIAGAAIVLTHVYGVHNLITSCQPLLASVTRISASGQLRGFVMYDEELDRFKFYNLPAFVASSFGFVIDKRKSSHASTVMRRGHEKIIISRKPDGHYVYWTPHDETDRGSIIDFVQRRRPGLSLGGVRKELRHWAAAPSPAILQPPALASAGKDLEAVRKRYDAMHIAQHHPFLENERGIPGTVVTHWRFAGAVKIDRFGAAVFPHRDPDGTLTGYEVKNTGGFTGYASGGRKQIWLSNTRPDDLRIVICESGCDSLSHAALFDDPRARYASTAGKVSAGQQAAIRAALMAMPVNSEIVAATDADDSGRSLAELIRTILTECGRDDLTFRRDEPPEKDWNDVLKKRRRTAPLPQRGGEPSVA